MEIDILDLVCHCCHLNTFEELCISESGCMDKVIGAFLFVFRDPVQFGKSEISFTSLHVWISMIEKTE